MELLTFIIVLLVQYVSITKIVKYTPIYQYDWIYNNKHLIKYERFKQLRDFKGFNCSTCHTFWISLVSTYLIVNLTGYNILCDNIWLYMCPILLWCNQMFEDMKYFNQSNNVNIDEFKQ